MPGCPPVDLSAMDRHPGRIAFSFSGGKDSTAVLFLLRAAGRLKEVTVYHVDTGDLLPEMREQVATLRAMCPRFVAIETRAGDWIARHGLPTDLVPHSAHWVGRAMAEARTPLVARYDCCHASLMRPLYDRILADGCTLLIRGTKAADMRRLPAASGSVSEDGVELLYPLAGWSNDQVFAFLRAEGAPVPSLYDHFENAPECATCPAWWGEKRMAYLAARHPDLARIYAARLRLIAAEVGPVIGNLVSEMGPMQPQEGQP